MNSNQIKAAVSFSDEYLNKVLNLLERELDEIDVENYILKYDQMQPFFELFSKLRRLTEDLNEIELVDLIEDLILKKNLREFNKLNFVRSLNDLRLCALDDIVELRVIEARDFLVKLRYLFPYYKLVVDEELELNYFEQSSYLQRQFLNSFPKLRTSFHFLLTCDLETLDKLNLEEAFNYEKIHSKLTQQTDEVEHEIENLKVIQFQNDLVHEPEVNSSKQNIRLKPNKSDKVLINEKLYAKENFITSENGQREELIIGEINYEPGNKANNFICVNFEGKHKELMLLSMKSTINVIKTQTFKRLNSLFDHAKECLVDLVINGIELGLQHAFVFTLHVHFKFVKIKMNYFYFDESEIPIEQNLIGNNFIDYIHSLSPCNYFTLKDEPDVKHLFLAESNYFKMFS